MSPPIPLRRQLLYAAFLTVVGTIVLLAILEGAARLLGAESTDDPHLALSGQLSFFREVEEDGERYYVVDHPDAEAKGVRFRIDKEPGTVRVFVLGGSAAAGWPHPEDQTFAAYLEQALSHALPDRPIEVLNVAGHGYASYRVRRILDDVIEFDPDLLILWSGNNEFFEVRSYRTAGWLQTLRNRSHLARAILRLGALDGSRRDDARARHAASTKILREPHRMRADEAEFAGVQEHFAYSVSEISRRADERAVPLVVATVPSNLRDWAPQVSLETRQGAEHKRWQRSYQRGRGLMLADRKRRAIAPLEAALLLEPDHADTHFLLGRGWEALRDGSRAAHHYRRAADLDYSPLRALSVFNDALRELTKREPNSWLLDLESSFAAGAQGAAPGFDLFLDYVHPTREGNLLAARRAFELIRSRELLGPDLEEASFHLDESDYRDEDDPFLQARVFMLCLAMHQHDGVRHFGPRLLEHIDEDPSLVPDPRVRPSGAPARPRRSDARRERPLRGHGAAQPARRAVRSAVPRALPRHARRDLRGVRRDRGAELSVRAVRGGSRAREAPPGPAR